MTGLVDQLRAGLGRVALPGLRASPSGVVRGVIDEVHVEVPAVALARLVVDRVGIRARDVRVVPGLPPRLRTGPVDLRYVVGQAAVDDWVRVAHLPVRLALRPEGVVVVAELAGVEVGRVVAELTVAGPFLALRPARVRALGLSPPLAGLLRGYLPLPPLPRGARVRAVEPGDGELAVRVVLDSLDEPLGPGAARDLARLAGRAVRTATGLVPR
ncbi:MAG: hypothetical protein AB7L84_07530 [Acidimicrobiia bacterium]